ncbi:Holliday junction resolvase RuvX, partial [bacterium]|nr:Holliday junction resolvase RuvX [bacterium]
VSQVADFAGRHEVGAIVIGLPLNMNGTRGEMAIEVERFGQAVESVTGMEVMYWDERLTSEQAKAVLQQRGKTSRERGDIDRVAACLMLESFLRANQT